MEREITTGCRVRRPFKEAHHPVQHINMSENISLTDYELQREARIASNHLKLKEIGIPQTIAAFVNKPFVIPRQTSYIPKRDREARLPTRRSERLVEAHPLVKSSIAVQPPPIAMSKESQLPKQLQDPPLPPKNNYKLADPMAGIRMLDKAKKKEMVKWRLLAEGFDLERLSKKMSNDIEARDPIYCIAEALEEALYDLSDFLSEDLPITVDAIVWGQLSTSMSKIFGRNARGGSALRNVICNDLRVHMQRKDKERRALAGEIVLTSPPARQY